jgi:hypothetical protein
VKKRGNRFGLEEGRGREGRDIVVVVDIQLGEEHNGNEIPFLPSSSSSFFFISFAPISSSRWPPPKSL